MSDQILIKGGRVIDSESALDGDFDVLVEDGKILAVDDPGAFVGVVDAEICDASGLIVVAGLIDIHVHLREPGFEWKETIQTGGHSAVCGGFTAVCCMPNTNPINDCAEITEAILEKSRVANLARVYPIGAITKGQRGESLAPMRELQTAGCVAFSDDGVPVSNAGVMRKALEYSLMLDTVLTVHEEELSLSEGFAMNESALSLKLGLPGMPTAAEDVMIARDIELARLTGARVHFCHVSSARAVTLIGRAKDDGIRVTAEVTPHHFTLTEQSVEGFDTNAKMSMPLRAEEDMEGVLVGLNNGTIDCIASDHAPHEYDTKNREFSGASNGIIGFQTTVPLALEKVRQGKLTLNRAIESLTTSPARCLNLPGGALRVGGAADIALIDMEKEVVFSEEMNRSKSNNSPFLGKKLRGVAVKTFVDGKQVYSFESEFGK